MYIRIKLIVTVLSVLFMSCDKDSGPSFDVSNNIYITVLNDQGEDLLNPAHPSTIDLSHIKVYYELDGVKTEINRGNLDFPQSYLVESPGEFSEVHRILLFLNDEDDSERTKTYFEWNSDRTDLIESSFNRGSFGVQNEKVWLNGELICDINVTPGTCNTTMIME